MKKQKIGIITYDCPHLKTEQVCMRLMEKDLFDLCLFALPFSPRKSRTMLFLHRPNQESATPTSVLAKRYNIPYIACISDIEINGCDIYLVLIGKIISPECIEGKKIINCHAGVIPAVRGLDAFKWAIYEGKPLGVTLHYIDKDIDAGEIISIVPTPVMPDDTLESLALRHYMNEIEVQSNFWEHIKNPRNDFIGIEEGEPHRRMGKEIEEEMIKRFPEYVKKFSKL